MLQQQHSSARACQGRRSTCVLHINRVARPCRSRGSLIISQTQGNAQAVTDKPPQQAENGASSNNNVVPFRQGARTPPPHHTSGSSARDRSSAVASPPKHVPDSSSSSSSCPFLQALQQPPHVKLAWWERVQQITAPMQMQSAVLDQTLAEGGSMVQLEQHLAFEVAYVPGTGSAVRSVLAGDSGSDPFTGPSLVPFFVRLMGEDSLLVVSGPKHKHLRGLLAPAFSPESVAGYVPQVAALVQRHLADWAAAGDAGVKGMDALKLLTFEFIVQLTFGRAYGREELASLHATYQQWINGLPAWPWLNIPFTPYAVALSARERLLQHFEEEVTAGRARVAAGEAVGGLLGQMLAAVDENGSRLTDGQICDNILLMLFAGHDTSSSTLTHCLNNLQNRPAAMQQLRAEQAAVVAKHGQQITAVALKDMPYAEAVIRETLRLDPVVAMLFRVALRDFEVDGYQVPAGKQLLMPLKYLAAHDGRWAGDQGPQAAAAEGVAAAQDGRWAAKQGPEGEGCWSPDAFVPERMLTPQGQKTGDLMPFGYGARYCLGSGLAMAEMKVLLALLARHYSYTAYNATEWVHTISKVPKNGLPLVVKPMAKQQEQAQAQQ